MGPPAHHFRRRRTRGRLFEIPRRLADPPPTQAPAKREPGTSLYNTGRLWGPHNSLSPLSMAGRTMQNPYPANKNRNSNNMETEVHNLIVLFMLLGSMS